jgi:hypothetical protein
MHRKHRSTADGKIGNRHINSFTKALQESRLYEDKHLDVYKRSLGCALANKGQSGGINVLWRNSSRGSYEAIEGALDAYRPKGFSLRPSDRR